MEAYAVVRYSGQNEWFPFNTQAEQVAKQLKKDYLSDSDLAELLENGWMVRKRMI